MMQTSTCCVLPIENYAYFQGIETSTKTEDEESILIFWVCEYIGKELAFKMHFISSDEVEHCATVGAEDIYGMAIVLSLLSSNSDDHWINILSTDNINVVIHCSTVCDVLSPVLKP